MKGLCGDCPARLTCKTLCPIAHAFVDKHIKRREPLLEDMDTGQHSKEDWPTVIHKSRKGIIVSMYFLDRRKQVDIAAQLGVSQGYISQVVREFITNILRI